VTTEVARLSGPPVARARLAVTAASAVALALKLVIAATTFGTEDVRTFGVFADGAMERGPVGVYSINFAAQGLLYNHPPLIGFYLDALSRVDLPLGFSLRAVSSLADMVSAVLVFELVQRRTTLRRGLAAGMLVGLRALRN